MDRLRDLRLLPRLRLCRRHHRLRFARTAMVPARCRCGGRRPWACSPPPPPAAAAAARASIIQTSPAPPAGAAVAERKRQHHSGQRFPPVSTMARPSPSGDRATPERTAVPAGDLLITITVRPHELFRREGTSVLCEAPITFAQAVPGRGAGDSHH